MLFEETDWDIEVDVDLDETTEAKRASATPAGALSEPPARKTTREMPATQLTYLNDQVRASIVRERNELRRAQDAIVQIKMPPKP